MATFCTNCGAALSPDQPFCAACGAPAAAPAAFVAPAAPPPAYQPVAGYVPPPVSVPGASVPGGSGSSVLKVILIVLAVFVGLGVLGAMIFAFGVWRISRAVHVNNAGDGVTLSTPTGSITTGKASTVSASDLGVAVYPGAVRGEGSMQIKTANGSMVTAIYSTSDSATQVLDFYKGKLGDSASVIETGNGSIITAGEHGKDNVMITVSTDDSSSSGGKTKISIMHTRKQP